MAENTRPVSSLPPTMTTKPRRTSRQPMANLEDSTNRTQLISPPPEETLNHLRRVSRVAPSTSDISTSKRKRNTANGNSQSTDTTLVETTPNPKPRKQLKNRNTALESPTKPSRNTPSRLLYPKSPHAENPDADWLPPIPSSASRRATVSARVRRTTPIPAYDPPADVFTPPREVVMPPTISKSSKRKSVNRRRTSVTPSLTITIKKELPQIDLTAPMPPGSPTDDPLLLSGPPEGYISSPLRMRMRNPSSLADSPPVSPLPPSSEPDDDDDVDQATERFDWTRHTVPEGSTDDMSMMEVDEQDRDVPPIPLFDLNYAEPANTTGGWDSSDEEDDELPGTGGALFEQGEGEYTGRWRQTRIPTKADPPSSATRDRMEEWGRPITPFPREKIKRLSLVAEVNTEASPKDDAEPVVQEELAPASVEPQEEEEEEEEREVRAMSLPLEEEEEQEELEVSRAGLMKQQAPPVSVLSDARFDFNQSFEEDEPQVELPALSPIPTLPTVDSRFNFDQSFEDSVEAEMPDMVQDELSLPHEDIPVEDASLSTTIAEDEPIPSTKLPEFEEEHSREEDEENEEEEREVREMSVNFRDQDEEEEEEEPGAQFLDPVHIPENRASLSAARHSLSPVPQRQQSPAPTPLTTRASPSPPQEESQRAPLHGYRQQTPTESRNGGYVHTLQAPGADTEEVVDDLDAEGGSSDSEDDSYDLGIVKITSADPRAAARAAAILKQHDYDCFTKIMMKQRRQSLAPGKAPSRRNSVIGGGIVKQRTVSEIEKLKKRRTTMGVIGETAYIPGSPIRTLPELLKEAEAEVTMMHSPRLGQTPLSEERNPFETPFPDRRSSASFLTTTTPVHVEARFNASGQREWTKEEWKLLDACFTDERLELGSDNVLASVDEVQLANVVMRFIDLMGGESVTLKYGSAWSRETLLQRANTLQAKQRSGKVAPPTTPYTAGRSAVSHSTRSGSIGPSITPLSHRTLSSKSQPTGNYTSLTPSAQGGGLFAHLSSEPWEEPARKNLPLSLLAPRYSHLLQEAIEVNNMSDPSHHLGAPNGADGEAQEIEATSDSERSGQEPRKKKGIKGFITSYLPLLQNSARPSAPTAAGPQRPSLPAPPSDISAKPRGPITTPMRPVQARLKHPKEIIDLQPAPLVQKSWVPERTQPKRLVDLHPVPVQEINKPAVDIPRPRRSSGASVKDLIKTFEIKEKEVYEENAKKWSRSRGQASSSKKPTWRP